MIPAIEPILHAELPNSNKIVSAGRIIGRDLKLGHSDFCKAMGVRSEAEYKQQARANGHIMYHAHIGMGSWPATIKALQYLDEVALSEGFIIDRAGICLDRRMALPEAYRLTVPAETGPFFASDQEWAEVGQIRSSQPHMGDFMIGFPASTVNTVNALRAGVTTIGNLSQFFAHQAPGWQDPVITAVETVQALAIMGSRRDDGLLVHSYLEDGFGALFLDCATVAGWALLERYIVEELLGAKLSHCIGGLTSDPYKRAGWVFALDAIHDHDCLGSMIYGDTISSTRNFPRNWGVAAEYLLWDILAQLECPTGHAVHPLPITEAVRIPSAVEIAEIQSFGRQIEATARRIHSQVDFEPARTFADQIVKAGREIFAKALDGLSAAGVDVRNPLQLLYTLKALGPVWFETEFGLGDWDSTGKRRLPLVPTDIFAQTAATIQHYLPQFATPDMQAIVGGRRLLLASTDVHEHAIFVLQELLQRAGATLINLGAEQNPAAVAKAALQNDVEAILISTHNGMALEYARQLKDALGDIGLELPILMGGVLNQKVESEPLPIDVSQALVELGIQTNLNLAAGWQQLLPGSIDD